MISSATVTVMKSRYQSGSDGELERIEYVPVIQKETLDTEELSRTVRDTGVHSLEVSYPGPVAAFLSQAPTEDRDYFENGIHTYFRMEILAINGGPVTPDGVNALAEQFGLSVGDSLDMLSNEGFSMPESSEALPPLFGYYVNLDERGSFYADLRNEHGDSVYSVYGGNMIDEDDMSLVEMGYMTDFKDTSGLHEYLSEMGIIPKSAEVMDSDAFEAALEERQTAEPRAMASSF